MSNLGLINPKAETLKRATAQLMNISAGKGLQSVLKSNLGPRGTLKMLVGGAGDIKITKDGSVLLHEMQIQHPTATLIARTATDQDQITGDGTTSNVLIIGEILKNAERHLAEGVHPRVVVEGFDAARDCLIEILNATKAKPSGNPVDRELLLNVARTSLRTKVEEPLAKVLSESVVDSLLTIRKPGKPIDLFMVEIMTMRHRYATDTALVKGIVLDHGARHPDMPKRVENAFILICNVDFEYQKPETNTNFNYSSTKQRDEMVEAEHKLVDEKVDRVIELKRKVCADVKEGETRGFVIINQKGIDPMSLDRFAKEGILALRRAKRRNMERLTLACGGTQINALEDLTPDVLGRAGLVQEQVLGEEKFTFVEKVENPFSVTILIKGPNGYVINQVKDAIRDGLRAVNNAIGDECVIPGGGAFEVAGYLGLRKLADGKLSNPRAKTGIDVIGESMLVIPKTLAENSGLDKDECIAKLLEAHRNGVVAGLDLETGEPMDPAASGIWDNYRVKRQILYSSIVIATQLLLVDEIMKAGKAQGGGGQGGGAADEM